MAASGRDLDKNTDKDQAVEPVHIVRFHRRSSFVSKDDFANHLRLFFPPDSEVRAEMARREAAKQTAISDAKDRAKPKSPQQKAAARAIKIGLAATMQARKMLEVIKSSGDFITKSPEEIKTTLFASKAEPLNIVCNALEAVQNATDDEDNLFGKMLRVLNEFPWTHTADGLVSYAVDEDAMQSWRVKYEKLLGSDDERLKYWVDHSCDITSEPSSDFSKAQIFKYKSIPVDENKTTLTFIDLLDLKLRKDFFQFIDEIISEARAQVLSGHKKIISDFIELFRLQPLLAKRPEKIDEIILFIINSFVMQIVIPELGHGFVEVKDRKYAYTEEQRSRLGDYLNQLHSYLNRRMIDKCLLRDSAGKFVGVKERQLTDHFKQVVFGKLPDEKKTAGADKITAVALLDYVNEFEQRKTKAAEVEKVVIVTAAKKVEPIPLSPGHTAVIQDRLSAAPPVVEPKKPPQVLAKSVVAFSVAVREPSKAIQELIDAFFNSKYPLPGVPDEFKLQNYAAVTPESRLRLIESILLQSKEEKIIKDLAADALAELACHTDKSDTSSYSALQAELKRLLVTAMPGAHKTEDKNTLDAMDAAIAKFNEPEMKTKYPAPAAMQLKLNAIQFTNTREISVNRMRLLLKSTAHDAALFVAILCAEHEAMQRTQKGTEFDVALTRTVDAIAKDEKFKPLREKLDQRVSKKDSKDSEKLLPRDRINEKFYKVAIDLLKYADQKQTTKFFRTTEKEELSVEAARAVAHEFVKYSLKRVDPHYFDNLKLILNQLEFVLSATKDLDSTLRKLLVTAYNDLRVDTIPEMTVERSLRLNESHKLVR